MIRKTEINRRLFMSITAGLVGGFALSSAKADAGRVPLIHTGQAMGAATSIRIDHPEAEAIAARVEAELSRLDAIFSLYREDSALMQLNREGALEAPPFELLDCLGLAGRVWEVSEGRFDPTVQVLWTLWAEAIAAGGEPDAESIADALTRTGWEGVSISAKGITLRPGMALTLNGIAQGYATDRVAEMLKAEGLDNIFVDAGEFRALGGVPGGGDWLVTLESGPEITLNNRALATSAPLGTTFDQKGRLGHILDPRTGGPVRAAWRSVSISAGSAALADALATACCLTEAKEDVDRILSHFPDARIEALEPV